MGKDWRDFKVENGGIAGAREVFENACETLFKKKYPQKYVSQMEVSRGDGGIDIFIGKYSKEPIIVVQCKFFLEKFESGQKQQIKDSFNKAYNNKDYRLSKWILCIPRLFTQKDNKWWFDWIEKQDMDIELINGNELISSMKEHNIYNKIFQIEDSLKIEEIHKKIFSKNKIDFINKYSSVPSLPLEYLPREEDMREIKKILLGKFNQSVGITGVSKKLGLHGMGGIGKSIFSIALGHDIEVREHFSDGIYFIQLGQNPDIEDIQIELLSHLGVENPNIQTIKANIASVFVDKKALLIIDDIWNIRDSNAFEIRGKNSKTLITTRQKDIVNAMGAKEYPIDLLSKEQSLMLLEKKVGKIRNDLLPLSQKLLERCGYLPLAINIIGSIIKGHGVDREMLTDILSDLESANLEYIEYTNQNEQHQNLYRVIDLSVNYLDDKIRDKYLSLSIFEDVKMIPRESLKNYWGRDFRRVILKLLSSSLIFQKTDDTDKVFYYTHDLQSDYIQFVDRDKKFRYREFIECYKKKYSDKWSDISINDFFFYNTYLEMCEVIDEMDLARKISEDILFNQSKINMLLIKNIILLLELDEKKVASKLLEKHENKNSLIEILNILDKNSDDVQVFIQSYMKQDCNILDGNLTIKCLNILGRNSQESQEFAKRYINENIDTLNINLIIKCLNILDKDLEEVQEFAKRYIEQDIDIYYWALTIKCLKILGKNSEEVQFFSKKYIQEDMNVHYWALTVKCLDILGKNSEENQIFSKKYIKQNIDIIGGDVAVKCLAVLGENSDEVQEFAKSYIREDIDILDGALTVKCLNILNKNIEEVQIFAKRYIEKNLDIIHGHLTIKCLDVLDKNVEEIQKFAKSYIKKDTDILDGDLTIKCLNILDKDLEEVQEFVNRYIKQDFNTLHGHLTIKCLAILEKEIEKIQEFANRYIEKNDRLNRDLTIKCLKILDNYASKRYDIEYIRLFKS